MSKTINLPDGTRDSHTKYVGWLNGLLTSYKSSFYDDAIKSIIELSFIKEHHVFIQEVFQGDGKNYYGFLTVSPTGGVPLIMLHDSFSGEPLFYNSNDGSTLFEFNASGILTKFYADQTVDLLDSDGQVVGNIVIKYENLYGINAAMIELRIGGFLVGKGFIDVVFDTRLSGTYSVKNTPLESVDKIKVVNNSEAKVDFEVPILPKFNIRYTIPSKGSVLIPDTDHSEAFLTSKDIPELLSLEKIAAT